MGVNDDRLEVLTKRVPLPYYQRISQKNLKTTLPKLPQIPVKQVEKKLPEPHIAEPPIIEAESSDDDGGVSMPLRGEVVEGNVNQQWDGYKRVQKGFEDEEEQKKIDEEKAKKQAEKEK